MHKMSTIVKSKTRKSIKKDGLKSLHSYFKRKNSETLSKKMSEITKRIKVELNSETDKLEEVNGDSKKITQDESESDEMTKAINEVAAIAAPKYKLRSWEKNKVSSIGNRI